MSNGHQYYLQPGMMVPPPPANKPKPPSAPVPPPPPRQGMMPGMMAPFHIPHPPSSSKPKNKKAFRLGSESGSNMMEDYLREGKIYSVFYPKDMYPVARDDEMRNELRKKYKEMKANPHHYFNFGFNMNDYIQYICKHYFMRLERDMVRKTGEVAVDQNK